MLFSLSVMLLLGIVSLLISRQVKLPALIFYLLVGIIIGPYALNWINGPIIELAAEIKKFALIVILIRAGLSLDFHDLKKVGKPAIFMCFVPATVEIIGSIIIGPMLFGINILDAFMIGTVIAAVSPAVVVPRMIQMLEQKKGTQQGIPQIILAGSSADDIYVLVLFSALLSMQTQGHVNYLSFLSLPVSIFTGILVGWVIALLMNKLLIAMKLSTTANVVFILAGSLALMTLESHSNNWFSGLISIIVMTMRIVKAQPNNIMSFKHQFNQLWFVAEMFLFMLVGMATNVQTALSFGWLPILFIIITSLFRMLGVYLALLPSNLTTKERVFTMGAYIPKATVQAAIGSIPLSMGLEIGPLILTIAVLEILLTAPLGALWIDKSQDKLIGKS